MAFLTDILTGIFLGCGYDFLKAIRTQTNRKAVLAICDILFWSVSCVAVLWVLFVTSDMRLRAYEFFGLLTGLFINFSVLSGFFSPLYKKIAEFLQLFFSFLFTTIRFFGIMIKNGVLFLCKPLVFTLRFVKKLIGKPVRAWKENLRLLKRI